MAGDELLNSVKTFLKDSGYPLEMKVARAFAGEFIVIQGQHYVDVATDKLRETDVIASAQRATTLYPDMAWAQLQLVIECKHSDKPWLLFTGDDAFTDTSEHVRCLDVIGHDELTLAPADSEDDLPVISHLGEVAYKVSTAFQKRDDAFDAVQQVNSAVIGVKRELVAKGEKDQTIVVVVPVIVTDAPLFSCRLDSTGREVIPTAANSGLLVNRLRVEDEGASAVWIVNSDSIEHFVDRALSTVHNMAVLH